MKGLRRTRAALATLLALAVEAAAVVGLGALGARREFAVPFAHVDDWLRVTPPADALAAVLRWVALLGAGWLCLGTVLYVFAAATRLPGAVRAVRWAALPQVRRAVDTAFAVTVVAGAAFAPAAASAADAPPTTAVRDGRSGGLASLPAAPGPEPTPAPPQPAPAEARPAPLPEPPRAATVVVIAPGDNLWEVAARQLATTTGRSRADVGDAEIAPAWVALCDRNRATLASGDPNLVYPGEVVVLPPVS